MDLKIYNGTPACCRRRCQRDSLPDHGFCRRCLDWLTEQADVDPLADLPDDDPTAVAELWAAYAEMLAAGVTA